ncbi:MAG: molybdopterin-dependent oxidoreductase [Actinobacteria bacterium]|nr:molybdopterin-dependent oxidoreductase [Actinomycetota bacterium]
MWVGRRLRRFEDAALLRGEGRFVGDIASGSAAMRFVRSPVARGKILDIEIPKGASVITGRDLEGVGTVMPLLHRDDFIAVEQPVLPLTEVHFAGQAVAAVIAPTAEEAEDFADQVFLEIDPLDPVVGLDNALSPDAPLVHEHVPGNSIIDSNMTTPGFTEAFEPAPFKVSVDIRSSRQSAMPLETRGGHAAFDASTGRVTLSAGTQAPHVIRTAIADVLGIPEADLRVVAPDVGGGFGQKYCLAVEDVVAVWAARRYRMAVAWIEDRRENFTSSFHSRDQHYLVTGAFDDDGKLVALEADIRCNVGAFSCYPVTCGVEALMAMAEMPGPYDFREYSVRARAVTTNACPIAPYRGVSRPVITMTLERLMDEAANRIGVSEVEIRRRNLVTEFPYTSVMGLVYDQATYIESLDRAVELIDLDGFRKEQEESLTKGKYIGLGLSTFSERTGYGTSAFAARSMDITPGFETVEMTMDPSGFVEVRVGASSHGQGLETSLSQLVADELGVRPENVRIVQGDTDRTPYGWGTFASRSAVLAGGASKLASHDMRAKLAAIAANELEAAVEDMEFSEGSVKVRGTDVAVEMSKLARIAYHKSNQLSLGSTPGLSVSATYDPHGTFSNACHAAVVEVDLETGAVQIRRFLVVEDAGILINPLIADGQVHGGVAQGIASALFEELVYDENGNLLTTSLMDYLPPTMSEMPLIEIEHLVSISDATITGAKGLGEGGAIGAPAAVINAINDALRPLGVVLNENPATPERVRRHIARAQGA